MLPRFYIEFALGYLSAPELYTEEKAEEYKKYLKGQRKRLLPLAYEKEYLDIVRYYATHNLIAADDISEFMKTINEKNNMELTALLLNYRNKSNAKSGKHEEHLFEDAFREMDVAVKNIELIEAIEAQSVEDVTRILSEGADPSVEPQCMIAALTTRKRLNPKIIALLLSHKAKMSGTTKDKQTLLHLAAKKHNAEVISMLLKTKASVLVKDAKKKTPPEIAARTGDSAAISAFLDGRAYSPGIAVSMLENAVTAESISAVEVLFSHFKTFEFTSRALATAMKKGSVDIFIFLLKNGASFDWCGDRQYELRYKTYRKEIDGDEVNEFSGLPIYIEIDIDFAEEPFRLSKEQSPLNAALAAALEQNLIPKAIQRRLHTYAVKYGNVAAEQILAGR